MTPFDGVTPWAFVLAVVVAVATSVVLRRYTVRVERGLRPTPEHDGGAAEPSGVVILPPNDTTGGGYLDDPARAGWEALDGPDATATNGDGSTAASTVGTSVTVPPSTVADARGVLSTGDVDRAVDRAYHAVREELTTRGDFDPGETPQEFRAACRAAFGAGNVDAVESLVDRYEQVSDGVTVERGVAAATLDRLVGSEGPPESTEWWESRQ